MLLFRIVSDSTDDGLMSYSIEVEPRQSKREQIAPNGTASGRPSQGVEHGLDISSLVGLLSMNANEPTHSTTQ